MTVSSETRGGLETIFLPPIDVIVKDVEVVLGAPVPTDEQDIAYNAWCTTQIKNALHAKEAENAAARKEWNADKYGEMPEYLATTMMLTHYPADTDKPDDDSRDVVALDRDGEVVVLDSGVR